ncbi:hypothetical protein [Cryptosporangium sp. NPDC048952]|uniref:hypothetical protein n=1 Tax=Cryptosporangium sp. NPDC048952 TaxID=3363961 RepID=UPI00371A0FBD
MSESTGVTDEERRRAMATYSGDGQNDDPTGGDALAEVIQARESEDDDERPTPDSGGQGPTSH